MEPGFKQDLEREEFSIRQRGTADAIQLKASASSRHWAQQEKINNLVSLTDEQKKAQRDNPKEFKDSLSNDKQELLDQQPLLRPAFIRHWGPGKNLCLFNIIVAFEWTPNYNDLRLLREATTSASVLLYDVTDGYMAIGHVYVGGKELMECADIQIFASNRLFPRSTVDGLNEPHKYQPIRLGRGLWHKNSRFTLPWDSELGFSTLVHEWGHYALGLKDQYLEIKGTKKVVVPVHNPVLNTIMAGPKKSELLSAILPADPNVATTDQDSEWSALSQHSAFSWLEIPSPYKNREIPPPQQLTPAYRLIGRLRQDALSEVTALVKGQKERAEEEQVSKYQQPHPILRWDQDKGPQNLISDEHCWVYIVKGENIYNPTALIAQGELESVGALVDHTIDGPALRLLGAEVGNMIVLVGHHKRAADAESAPQVPLVLYATITNVKVKENNEVETTDWIDVTPESIPSIHVTAAIAKDVDGNKLTTHNLSVTNIDLNAWKVFICPLGDQATLSNAPNKKAVTALDGHVMLVPPNGDNPYLMIAGYSLGGSPDSGFPVHPNPIPAGSSDGNAMIFFYEPQKKQQPNDAENPQSPQTGADDATMHRCPSFDYADVERLRQCHRLKLPKPTRANGLALDEYRIVTTTNYQAQATWSSHWEPRSYTFAVTTNQSLAPLKPAGRPVAGKQADDYLPTLVLYFDKHPQLKEGQKLVIARLDGTQSDGWSQLPTEIFENSIAALALDKDAAPGLFETNQTQLHVEYFRLFLVTEQ